MRAWTAIFAAIALTFSAAPATQNVDTFKVSTFGQVSVYRPASAPSQVGLFVSGDGGWNLGVVSMAERLRDLGARVVGVDIRTFLKSLETSKGCAYPAGALEELSRAIQLRVPWMVLQGEVDQACAPATTRAFVAESHGAEYQTVPEIERLTVPVTRIQGAGDEDPACGEIRNPRARVVTVGSGHHFGGEYARLVDAILERR